MKESAHRCGRRNSPKPFAPHILQTGLSSFACKVEATCQKTEMPKFKLYSNIDIVPALCTLKQLYEEMSNTFTHISMIKQLQFVAETNKTRNSLCAS